ncbi:hypothetical protein [Iodobacter fluviatilis]|uniref:Predicted integral membrane protein n=1 Tax=Iodobacter fluviatilis TaxID=537 RepID=A0A377SWD7_9NEIS|nr:hypothetical protein [Iodobacter fluviatilis]TCU85023.1 hypothetical protein EV682_10846 [Iodobacter fluviatilis]STR45293.1 Predicted integral membrane protein [Iodobacter fluviatilis]
MKQWFIVPVQLLAVISLWAIAYLLLYGQIQKQVDTHEGIPYPTFSWAAPQLLLNHSHSIQSLSLQGYIPSTQTLSILCNQEPLQSQLFKQGYFTLSHRFKNSCPNGLLSIQSSYSHIPATKTGSQDQRVLSYQLGLVQMNGKDIALTTFIKASSGLYGLEENFSRINTTEILSRSHDAGWYHKIASKDYAFNGDRTIQQTVAWPFLYPYSVKAIHAISGLDIDKSMLRFNLICSLLAMLSLFYLGKLLNLNTSSALLAPAWFAFNPFSFFVFGGFSESLFMLLFSAALILTIKEKWISAAFMISAMTASRFIGGIAILLLMLYWLSIHYQNQGIKKSSIMIIKMGLISTLGILLDMAVKAHATGEPLAAFLVRSAWKISPLQLVTRIFDLRLIQSAEYLPVLLLAMGLMIYAIYICILCIKNHMHKAALIAGSGALILGTTLLMNPEIHSVGRYSLSLAPCIIGILSYDRLKQQSTVLIALSCTIGAAFSGLIISNIYSGLAPF